MTNPADHPKAGEPWQSYKQARHQRKIAVCARRAVRDVFDAVRAEFGIPRKWSKP